MAVEWSKDYIHDIILPLQNAQRLWDMQLFTRATEERKEAIIQLLEYTKTEIDQLLNELGETNVHNYGY